MTSDDAEAEATLADLEAAWRAHDREAWAGDRARYRNLAARLQQFGNAVLANEVVDEGLASCPGDLDLLRLRALLLANLGGSDSANRLLRDLYDGGHRDVETLGLLARTHKDLALGAETGDERAQHFRRAAHLYDEAYHHKPPSTWAGINAATMHVLLGDRETAAKVAREVRAHCEALLGTDEEDRYWLLATIAEAALIAGDDAEALAWYRRAASESSGELARLASTLRNARLLAEATGLGSVDELRCALGIPGVVAFCGHMLDGPERRAPRFPVAIVPAVEKAITETLDRLDARIGFASAACGSDLLFHEAVLARGGETHLILPYGEAAFVRDSVEKAGGREWVERFQRVRRHPRAVLRCVTEDRLPDVANDYGNRFFTGLAELEAERLETEVVAVAAWDGRSGDGSGGTESLVRRWRAAGREVHIIDIAAFRPTVVVREAEPPAPDRGHPESRAEVVGMLYVDTVEFAKIPDRLMAVYVDQVLGRIGAAVAGAAEPPLVRESRGHGYYFVFPNLRAAGSFALELRDRLAAVDWRAIGFPWPLSFRMALHAGPLFCYRDPVTGQRTYSGTQAVHGARIEPISVPGQIYASEAFAALSAGERIAELACEYVGAISVGESEEPHRVYHLRRRARAAAPGASRAATPVADRSALLLELSRAVGSLTEIGDLLALVNARTKQVLDAESCAIMLFDEEKGELYFPEASDAGAGIGERFRMIRTPADRGISGWVLRTGTGAFVPDASRDERVDPDVDAVFGGSPRSLLYAPLRTRQGVLGVIGLGNRRTGTFAEDDLALLEAIAGPVAVAIENARLYMRVEASPPDVRDRTWVGRERELAELESGLADAVAGRGRLFLINGEPGIGKTRLAEELSRRAEERGALPLWGRCWEGGGAPANWPWVQIFRALARASPRSTLASQLGADGAYVARIAPEIRDRVPELPDLEPPDPTLDSEHARFQLFDAVASFLQSASETRPLVLILDDLHWADAASLRLLKFCARELRAARLLFVGTVRDAENPANPAVAEALLEVVLEARTIRLLGLSPPEAERLIEVTSGIVPFAGLAAIVHRATGGNPFFIDAVTRLLASEGRLQNPGDPGSGPLGLPDEVRGSIRRRLHGLSRDSLRVLTIASVIGHEFDRSSLEATSALEREAVWSALAEAKTAGILVEVSPPLGLYRFAHGLIAETLYGELTPVERVEHHRRVAEALETTFAGGSASRLAELARHYFEAIPAGTADQAVDYAIRAGKQAVAAFAWEAGVREFERARVAMELGARVDPERRMLVEDALRSAREMGTRHVAGKAGAPEAEASEGAGGNASDRPTRPRSARSEAVFRKEGDFWTIGPASGVFRLKDMKGFHHLRRLLEEPGREWHCSDLVGEGVIDAGDAGSVIDARARSAYRRRLEDLREELEEAERFGDLGRTAKARKEIEVIGRELAVAVGLGGRDRRVGRASERARLNVTRTVKDAIARISENDPVLGRHLATAVRTGAFCSYEPDPHAAITWLL